MGRCVIATQITQWVWDSLTTDLKIIKLWSNRVQIELEGTTLYKGYRKKTMWEKQYDGSSNFRKNSRGCYIRQVKMRQYMVLWFLQHYLVQTEKKENQVWGIMGIKKKVTIKFKSEWGQVRSVLPLPQSSAEYVEVGYLISNPQQHSSKAAVLIILLL